GILLEVARALAVRPPARPVLLAFTASEEDGLAGARGLVDRLPDRIGLAVALDLVGAAPTALNGLSSLIGRDWLAWIARGRRTAGVPLAAPWPHRIISRHFPQIERSDHGPFTARGVPAFHLYGRGPDRIYSPYHQGWDDPSHLDPEV